MRNLAAKVPDDVWPEFKTRVFASYQAPSRAIARDLADGIVTDFDFTADVVELEGQPEAKVGRGKWENPRLIRVDWDLLKRLDEEVDGGPDE
jgi:hypothetical protein